MYNKYKCAPHPDMRAKNIAQLGIAAIEFALVFPVFFLLLYGIITYAMIFVAQQSLTLAAEEGARAALRYTTGDRGTVACGTVIPLVSWLGSAICVQPATATCAAAICVQPATAVCAAISTSQCITVRVSYSYSQNPLVPSLPGLAAVLPTTLGSSATVQIN